VRASSNADRCRVLCVVDQPAALRLRDLRKGWAPQKLDMPPQECVIAAYRAWRVDFTALQEGKTDEVLAQCGLLLNSIDVVES